MLQINNKFHKLIFIIITILFFDYLFSFFIKNKKFWHEMYPDKYWRIPSYIYHHDLKPNVEETET